jgi:hypothetical protein
VLHPPEGLRGQSLALLDVHPYQVDWDSSALIYSSRLVIEIRYASSAALAQSVPAEDPFGALLDAVALNPGLATSAVAGARLQQAAARNVAAIRSGSLKLLVTEPGIHSLSAAELVDAGLSLEALANPNLQLTRNGSQVPLELRGTGTSAELRFHGEPSTSRYQAAQVYWLFVGDRPGLRAPATAGPGLPVRWEENTFYASQYADGADGWFARDLRLIDEATRTMTATFELPASAPAGSRLQMRLQGYVPARHVLEVNVGNLFTGSLSWDDTRVRRGSEQPFTGTITLDTALPPGTLTLTLTLASLVEIDGIYVDWIALPDLRAPETSALLSPSVQPDSPSNLAQGAADYLIVSHASFLSAVQPLVALHEARGLKVRAVDVQDVYDEYSFGMLDPEAIRSFVSEAYRAYSPAPRFLLLVGDGTSNFKDYYGLNDNTFIPPYLVDADPWLGEIACDTCFARVAGPGNAPVSDVTNDLLPDLFVGRLPVRSLAQAQGLVAKLLDYNAGPTGGWQAQYLFVTDRPRDESGTPDPAGDFIASAEAAIAQLPPGAQARRFFYDLAPPTPRPGSVFTQTATLRRDLQTAWDQGAALVTYIGHSNQWQWGSAATSQPPYLWAVFDAERRMNGARAPILLALTCLTGIFQKPIEPSIAGNAALESTTDEWLLLQAGGGTIASLSPSGLGVATGHDLLNQGVLGALLGQEPSQRALGAAHLAGFVTLLGKASCCRDLLFTYNLLGDPATALPFVPQSGVWLPLVRR